MFLKNSALSQQCHSLLVLLFVLMISACSSSSSDEPTILIAESDFPTAIVTANESDMWECIEEGGSFGGYLFYSDGTGSYHDLAFNGPGNFHVQNTLPFSYAFTSTADRLKITYTSPEAGGLVEFISEIMMFESPKTLLAESDIEGELDCSRRGL